MDKVECAKKMKDILQMMNLWPQGVDLLSDNTDAKHKLIYCAGENPPLDGWISSSQKMHFLQALVESDVYPPDIVKHGFVDVNLTEGGKLQDEPAIIRLSQIEKAIQSEHLKGLPPSDGRGGSPSR
jgi:hypothetical protein